MTGVPEQPKEEDTPLLTPREIDVIEEIKKGNTARQSIAAALSVSEQTVKTMLENIYEKFELATEDPSGKKIQALLKAIESGQVEDFKPTIDVTKTPIYKIGLGKKSEL